MTKKCIDWVTEPTVSELLATPLIHPNDSVLAHNIERRGFVTVPMDYTRPAVSPTLKIFYRFIPTIGGSVDDMSKPVVVVINGGPGAASSHYRVYDFDYTGKVAPSRPDYLGELTKYFRVLIIDQRGTAGNSTQIDLNNPKLQLPTIVRYFDDQHIALDHQEVINQVLPSTRYPQFAMVAQSFGGLVGMRYMNTPAITRLPSHLCFSSAAMPHSPIMKTMTLRREKQLEMNKALAQDYPHIGERITALRAHFRSLGLDENVSHYLWHDVGAGEEGAWQQKLLTKVERLLSSGRTDVVEWIASESESNFLNYILSPMALSPGYTDLTLAVLTSQQIPYPAAWMPDENWVLANTGRDGTWRETLLAQLDENPPHGKPWPTQAEIRNGLMRTRVMFSLADGDVYLPLDLVRETASPYYSTNSREVVLPGGHKALFLPQGASTFYNWTIEP